MKSCFSLRYCWGKYTNTEKIRLFALSANQEFPGLQMTSENYHRDTKYLNFKRLTIMKTQMKQKKEKYLEKSEKSLQSNCGALTVVSRKILQITITVCS